jgi:hypothetical protein
MFTWNPQLVLKLSLISALSASALALAPLGAWAKLPTQLEGKVTERGNGKGISGVRVQQLDSLEIAITDQNGYFQLPLNPNRPPELHIEKQGFEAMNLAIQESDSHLDIGLSARGIYQGSAQTVPPSMLQTQNHVLNTAISGFYQIHGMSIDQGQSHVNGIGVNELGADFQWRWNQWLFNGNYFNFRLPVNIENFPYSPAFFNNETQIRLGAAYTLINHENFEFAMGPEVLYRNTSPDNRNAQDKQFIPFSNTHLDYPQNSFALGLRAVAGWKLMDQLTLQPEVSFYPLGIANIEQPQTSAQYLAAGNVGASLKYTLVPGLAVLGSYTRQILWTGPALEQGDYFRVGLSLDPWQMLQSGAEKP